MSDLRPAEAALRELMARTPTTSDPVREVREVLEGGDERALHLLQLGVLLKVQARKDEGIRKAQRTKKKYPGRTPEALKLGATSLDRLIGVLEGVQAGEKVNLAEAARKVGIGRSTLYRYLKTPEAARALATAKKAIGQGYRNRPDLQEKTMEQAKLQMERALKESARSRSNRPVYEAAAAELKATRDQKKREGERRRIDLTRRSPVLPYKPKDPAG